MQSTLKTRILASIVIAGLLVVASIFALSIREEKALGSVAVTGEYNSTSTQGLITASTTVLFKGTGTLGSVVITMPELTTGTFFLYDGTTTSAHPDWASTTLASFSSASPANTYTFDLTVQKGLIFEYKGVGLLASTTVTYRK